MHPILQHEINDLHQHDLILEADQRRRAAQVPKEHRVRRWTGSFFLALGHALIASSTAKTAITSAACVSNPCRTRVISLARHAHASPVHSFPASPALCPYAGMHASRPHP